MATKYPSVAEIVKGMQDAGFVMRKDLQENNKKLRKEIENSNTSLKKEIENSNTSLRKEIKKDNHLFRKEFREEIEKVVHNQLTEFFHNMIAPEFEKLHGKNQEQDKQIKENKKRIDKWHPIN